MEPTRSLLLRAARAFGSSSAFPSRPPASACAPRDAVQLRSAGKTGEGHEVAISEGGGHSARRRRRARDEEHALSEGAGARLLVSSAGACAALAAPAASNRGRAAYCGSRMASAGIRPVGSPCGHGADPQVRQSVYFQKISAPIQAHYGLNCLRLRLAPRSSTTPIPTRERCRVPVVGGGRHRRVRKKTRVCLAARK